MQLHRARSDFDAAGVELVLIGQGGPRQAAHFRRRQGVELQVLADEKRASYRAAGAKVATMSELVGPKSVAQGALKTVRSAGKVRQGKVIGHPAQLGGTLLVVPDGSVTWSHMSEDAGDNASPADILAAAERAAPRKA